MSAGSKTNNPPIATSWRPGASLDALTARARMLAGIRAFFASRGVLEVETPLACSAPGTDPALAPLQTRYVGPGYADGLPLYLQTSPEFAMKRLLAAGCGPIYQICKAFRDGEAGRLHNPEFTILEWYRPGFSLDELVNELVALVRDVLQRPELRVNRVSYAALFDDYLGIDIFRCEADDLRRHAGRHGLLDDSLPEMPRDAWLDLLLSHLIQPQLGSDSLCVVDAYPASQAALARVNSDGATAARFELFMEGIELANGFDELVDAEQQAKRFNADNALRKAAALPTMPVDTRLLGALRDGMPDCCGVAVGLDRLLMLHLGKSSLDDVLSFSLNRC